MPEGTHGADGMQATQQATEHQQVVWIVQLRRAPAKALEQAETETGKFKQRLAVDLHGRYHWNVPLGQLQGELMFLENRRVSPALWPVELGNQRLAVFDTNLEYPVLVAVQRQSAGVADKAERLHRIQYGVRGQQGKR